MHWRAKKTFHSNLAQLKMRKFRDNKISLQFHITFDFSCGGPYCENIIIGKNLTKTLSTLIYEIFLEIFIRVEKRN